MTAEHKIAPPLDEAGAGRSWIVLEMMIHAARGALSGRVLLLSAVGLLLAEVGANLLAGVETKLVSPTVFPAGKIDPLALLQGGWHNQVAFWRSLVEPFLVSFPIDPTEARSLLAGVWRLAVWSLFGVAIARVAAMQLTHNERPTFTQALQRSFSGWFGRTAGPLALLLGVGLAGALVWFFGYVSRVEAIGLLVAIAWPVVVITALIGALLGLSLALGAPLMWASHAVERPDPFDAVSSGVAFVYQRPLRFLAYVLQALAVGAVVGALLLVVMQATIGLLAAWFTGANLADEAANGGAIVSVTRFWLFAFASLPAVFHAAYFWFAAVAVYLLLRRDIDEKQADEVYLEDQPTPASVELPSDTESEAESET